MPVELVGDKEGGGIRQVFLLVVDDHSLLPKVVVQSLRAIDRAITGSLDLRVTLDVILEQVTSRLKIDTADMLLLDAHSLTLHYATGRGFRTTALQHTRLQLGEGLAGRAALERRHVFIPNLAEDTDGLSRAPLLASEAFVVYYAVLLISKGHVKGVLELFHRSPLDPDRLWIESLEAMAAQAAIAIDNAEMFDNLQRSHLNLRLAYDATIVGWARALELRDQQTEGHTQRVTRMALRLARDMGIGEAELAHMHRGALLHDMGKMGVPARHTCPPNGPIEIQHSLKETEPIKQFFSCTYSVLLGSPTRGGRILQTSTLATEGSDS